MTKVLLVDDDDVIRQALGRLLVDDGWTLLFAHDGREAMRVLEEHEGDVPVVISDLDMPVLRGDAFVQEAAVRFPLVRVVLHSGHPDIERIATRLGVPWTEKIASRDAAQKLREQIAALIAEGCV